MDYLFYGMGCKNTVYEELLNRIPDQALPCLKKRIPLETDPSDKWYRRDLFPETVSDERVLLSEAEALVKPEDTACIMFTSGTYQPAKGRYAVPFQPGKQFW